MFTPFTGYLQRPRVEAMKQLLADNNGEALLPSLGRRYGKFAVLPFLADNDDGVIRELCSRLQRELRRSRAQRIVPGNRNNLENDEQDALVALIAAVGSSNINFHELALDLGLNLDLAQGILRELFHADDHAVFERQWRRESRASLSELLFVPVRILGLIVWTIVFGIQFLVKRVIGHRFVKAAFPYAVQAFSIALSLGAIFAIFWMINWNVQFYPDGPQDAVDAPKAFFQPWKQEGEN